MVRLSGLYFVTNHMHQRHLGDLVRKVGALGGPVAERRPELCAWSDWISNESTCGPQAFSAVC
jgi:hypothetical protein